MYKTNLGVVGCKITPYGRPGSCIPFFYCKPFVHLISNLTKPFPSYFPSLVKRSLVCGKQHVGGFNVPKVCCPPGSFSEKEEVSTSPPTTSENVDGSTTPKITSSTSNQHEVEESTSIEESTHSNNTKYTLIPTDPTNTTPSIHTENTVGLPTTKPKPITDAER